MRIVVATPNYTRQLDGDVVASVNAGIANLRRHGHDVPDHALYSYLYVDKGRNDLAESAIKDGFDAVLFWDADQTIYLGHDDDLAALFNLGPVVTAAYLSRRDPRYYVLWEDGTGVAMTTSDVAVRGVTPFPVAKCGAGALWVRREVFEKVPYPWFRSGYRAGQVYFGEDIFFFEQVRAYGFTVMVNPVIQTGHLFNGVYVHRGRALDAPSRRLAVELAGETAGRVAAGDAARAGWSGDATPDATATATANEKDGVA